jgi:hypothetical protein
VAQGVCPHRVSSIIYIEKKVLTKNRGNPVPALPQLESFAPCFRDSPPGAVCVETLREVRLAASRGNRVQTKEQARVSEPFAVALCVPKPVFGRGGVSHICPIT